MEEHSTIQVPTNNLVGWLVQIQHLSGNMAAEYVLVPLESCIEVPHMMGRKARLQLACPPSLHVEP